MILRLTSSAGRSLAACRQQFGLLTNRVSSFLVPSGPAQSSLVSPAVRKKQPPIGQSQMLPGESHLQPQQYQFAPINEPNNPAAFQSAPYIQGDIADKSGKKRGRPSKAERELREAEARARGEVYQPTKRKPKTPRPSAEGAAAGEESSSANKKAAKRARTGGEATDPTSKALVEQGAAFQTTSGDQMQVDTPERQFRSTIPETQVSSFPSTEDFLAGMQEQAAISETAERSPQVVEPPFHAGTAQSSTTLPEGTPGKVSKVESTMAPTSHPKQPPEAKMT